MFTKKIALFGLAGLTAFAMSCSETDDEEPGGSFDPPLTIVDGTSGVELGGKIVANEGATIEGVKIYANGTAISFVPGLTGFGTGTVSLEGQGTSSVCDALGATAPIPSLTIKVVADFDAGAPLEGEKTLTNYACGGPGTPLATNTVSLSTSGSSFADVDGAGAAYSRATLTMSNVKNVDVVARYSDAVTPDGKIYLPIATEIPMATGQIYAGTTDLFWSVFLEACPGVAAAGEDEDAAEAAAAACAMAGTMGNYGIQGWQLPPDALTELASITTVEQLLPFLGMANLITDGESVEVFSGAAGSGFLLYTSKKELVAVIVSATGNTATAITLNGVLMPSNDEYAIA